MPIYEHDGFRFAYYEAGEGTPVLLAHGATGTGEFEWGKLAAALSPEYHCIAPDLRGHGLSDFRADGYGRAAITADLLALIRHVDAGRPHVVGFSYGAERGLRMELQ